jgi:hypothetical protein
MAQNSQKSAQRPKSTRAQSGASPKRGAAAAKRTPSATKRTNRSSARSGSSGNGSGPKARRSSSKSPVASARETVVGGAQNAGHAVGSAANAAKVPAVAGGAALAGLVGGMALARGGRRRVLGVPVPGTRRPLVKINGRGSSTKQLMKTGRQMAELAVEVRQARQQLATDRRRSPIEVVLDGLTARRGRDLAK